MCGMQLNCSGKRQLQNPKFLLVIWTKKYEKGREEWEQPRFENGMQHQKLKTLVKTKFASKVVMFKETLEFKNATFFCYGK